MLRWLFGLPRVPREVLDRLDYTERELTSLKLQWAELLDKVQRWMQRTIKRDARDVEVLDQADGLDPISRQILQRRRPRIAPRREEGGG